MSESDRGNGFRIVTSLFILAVFSILIAGIYASGREHGKAIGKNEANTSTYAKHAQDYIEKCLSISDGVSKAECIREVIESTNEHNRAENDLVAQTEMSIWALWMLIVTSIMAFVTAVGVYFVWGTLNATREMARETKEIGDAQVMEAKAAVAETRRIGEAQVRAYLQLLDIKFIASDLPCLGFEIQNSGQSPAKNVKAFVKMSVTKIKCVINKDGKRRPFGEDPIIDESEIHIPNIAANAKNSFERCIVNNIYSDINGFDAYHFSFKIAFFWQDVFGRDFREDAFCVITAKTEKIKIGLISFGEERPRLDMIVTYDVGDNRLTDDEIRECKQHKGG